MDLKKDDNFICQNTRIQKSFRFVSKILNSMRADMCPKKYFFENLRKKNQRGGVEAGDKFDHRRHLLQKIEISSLLKIWSSVSFRPSELNHRPRLPGINLKSRC